MCFLLNSIDQITAPSVKDINDNRFRMRMAMAEP